MTAGGTPTAADLRHAARGVIMKRHRAERGDLQRRQAAERDALETRIGVSRMTPAHAAGGHCIRGGTIASGDAACQCGAWRASDYPPAFRSAARRMHLVDVFVARREGGHLPAASR